VLNRLCRPDGPFVAAGAILGDRLLDLVQQILISNRFGQELDRAALHGPNRHRDIGVATDEDNRHAQIGPGQLLLKSSPLRPGSLTSRTRHAGTCWGAVEEFLDRCRQMTQNIIKFYTSYFFLD
jgi:hypothetical protein